MIIMSLQCYGYLFGKIKLIKDTHLDEVYIEHYGIIVMQNNVWCYSYSDLVAIANELKEGLYG